jgi:hypothetical protein
MRFVAIIAVVLVMSVLGLFYGGQLFKSRFNVGKYTYRTPAGQAVSFSDEVVLGGVQATLAHCGFDPSAWVPLASTNPEHRDFTLQTNGRSISVLIVLTNRVDGKVLYVRADPTPHGDGLEFDVYRSE